MDRTREPRLAEEPRDLGARLVGVAAGAWLFASAFLWPHTEAQRGNCLVVGAIVAAVAAIGGDATHARFVRALAAAWLFISGFALRTLTPDTIVSDVFVAIVVFASCTMDGADRLEGPNGVWMALGAKARRIRAKTGRPGHSARPGRGARRGGAGCN